MGLIRILVVIAENIYTHYERGKSPVQATVDGTMEVISSVFTSVLTTVIAFSVLMFVEGMEQMKEMAFVVIASLLFSMIEAFLVLPSHLNSKKLQQIEGKRLNWFDKFKQQIEKGIDYVKEKFYGEVLKSIVYKKWLRRTIVYDYR